MLDRRSMPFKRALSAVMVELDLGGLLVLDGPEAAASADIVGGGGIAGTGFVTICWTGSPGPFASGAFGGRPLLGLTGMMLPSAVTCLATAEESCAADAGSFGGRPLLGLSGTSFSSVIACLAASPMLLPADAFGGRPFLGFTGMALLSVAAWPEEL